MRKALCMMLAAAIFLAGCDARRPQPQRDVIEEARLKAHDEIAERRARQMEIAKLEQDIGENTAASLSEDLAFYQAGRTVAECETAYRECRNQAKLATSAVSDYLIRKIQEHDLARDGMLAKGYRQLPAKDLPAGAKTQMVDGVAVAGE